MTNTSSNDSTAPIAILVPGYWLGAWAWEAVEPGLRAAGIETRAVTLPGLDGGPTDDLTLDDHVAAVARVVEGLVGPVVLVGHSGGAPIVQTLVDRDPERYARVVYVDAGPMIDGIALRPDATDDLPLPSWEELAANHVSAEGMDDATLDRFRERAVDHPGGVARSAIHLTNERRLDVPITVICTSLPSPVLQQMMEAGQMPSELPSASDVRYVDLPTGHWPMFSRPDDLAEVLAAEITRSAGS